MDVKKQIKAIRDIASRLNYGCCDVFHAEGGVRGDLLSDIKSNKAGQMPDIEAMESFFSRFLATAGKPEDAICNGYIPGNFNFKTVTSKGIQQTETRAISVVYGNPEQIQKLARLIASPVTKYLREHFNKDCGRKDSYFDMPIAITEWIYIMYEIGSEVDDPNFERCYCLINPFEKEYLPSKEDMLSGYSDTVSMTMKSVGDEGLWPILWNAAKRHELAYSKMGTDLFLASRIALDHLLDMKGLPEFIENAEQKLLKHSLISYESTGSKVVVNGFMSVADFAKIHGVNAGALRKRLERLRGKNPLDSDMFIESQNREKNKPQFLYNPKRVELIIEDMKV